jgi:predicted dehydrogenase
MPDRPAQLIVAGLGRIGRLHAENLTGRVKSAELAGVADSAETLAREAGERFGVPWWTSFGDALGTPDVDGVVIATPTAMHPEMVVMAVAADKHVFCEKPLAFESDAGRRAVEAARNGGRILQVGFQRRFDPDWVEMKRALDSGTLGELRVFRSSHRNAHEVPASGELGNVFVDVAIHDLDAAVWLGGEVTELFAMTCPGGGASIVLRFACGALGLIDVSRNVRYGFDCAAELIGSDSSVRTGYQSGPDTLEWMRDGWVSSQLAADHAQRHATAYVQELERFGELAGGATELTAPSDHGMAALDLALAAGRSAHAGEPVRFSPRVGEASTSFESESR